MTKKTTARTAKPATTPTLFVGQSTTSSTHAAPQGDDFVSDVLSLVAERLPDADDATLRAVDVAIRERWGGDRPYIARRHGEGRSDRNMAIRRDFAQGAGLGLLERRYGLCKRQLLRIVAPAAAPAR
jgi:Mor family transcriptional regulator